MKKILMLCAAMIAVGIMSSCGDYEVYLGYGLNNRSEHSAIVSFGERSISVNAQKDTMICLEGYSAENETKEQLANEVRRCYGDSVVIKFDDNRKVVYHASEMIPNGPYDFSSDKYKYLDDEVNTRPGQRRFWMTLIYTIDEDDYDRAE